MTLKTKSIQKRKSSQDGVRICVMRRIKPEYDFDLWLPHLAPSEELLQAYVIDQSMSWDEFQPKYLAEVKKQTKYFTLLQHLLAYDTVTLLCWEDTPEYCHRSLLARHCQQLTPDIKLILA